MRRNLAQLYTDELRTMYQFGSLPPAVVSRAISKQKLLLERDPLSKNAPRSSSFCFLSAAHGAAGNKSALHNRRR